jgi:hypothetical protein
MKQAKQKKCKQCKSPFTPFNSMQKVCGAKCAQAFAVSEREKKEAKVKSDEVKRVRQKLKQLSMKDRPKALRAAQAAFNAYIRERDKKLNCISCGNKLKDSPYLKGQLYDAGHYRSVGSAPELRFCELNCFAQCVYCNRNLSGNIVNYRKTLLIRIGESKLKWLEGHHEPKKYTVDELWQIRDTYKAKLKELKALD